MWAQVGQVARFKLSLVNSLNSMKTVGILILLSSQCSANPHVPQETEVVLGGVRSNGEWSTLDPDPSLLVWDQVGDFKEGWLKVPLLHDYWVTDYEASPKVCLRVRLKPARVQPAKLGPILLHCGGPGSDARCAGLMGKWFELNSTYLVGEPLSDEYDYWSISQRGMDQLSSKPCPSTDGHGDALKVFPDARTCDGIRDLVRRSGWPEVLKRLDGNPDEAMAVIQEIQGGPNPMTFGNIYYNETYVTWLYRLLALQGNLCYNDPTFRLKSPMTDRTFNMFDFTGTSYLARDIEVFRRAIGAKKMSIYGISYGTKVGSVYATEFPDKVHRLVLDGNMGFDPDIRVFADWVGKSTEEVWTGLVASCDNSAMAGGPPESVCVAGPGVDSKFFNIFKKTDTDDDKKKAAQLFYFARQVIYTPGAPRAPALMQLIKDLSTDGSSLSYAPHYPSAMGTGTISAVLGMDLAGRFTEKAALEWWRRTKETQPIGITRSLLMAFSVGTWPGLPRPQPPVGHPSVAPLVIGNLYDGQTPYQNAQQMVHAFSSGRLITTQFYGHGMQGPDENYDVMQLVNRYEREVQQGKLPTYDDEVAKLLCVRVLLSYLKNGMGKIKNHVCSAAGPKQTWPGVKSAASTLPTQAALVYA